MASEPAPYWDVADELGRMTALRFTALCNDLIHAERLVARQSLDSVDTTTNINAPDGGVDARTRFGAGTDFVPVDETVWQYKATNPGPADLAAEITERDDDSFLLSRLRAGAKYVVLATADWPPEQTEEREKELRKALAERGLNLTEVYVRNASDLAQWVSRQPAVAATHVNRVPPGFEPLRTRMAQPRYSQPFHPDPARKGLINDVATALGSPGGARHIRIEGPAGIGKTRAAMEALQPFALIALYCANPPGDPAVGRELVRSGKIATLILDECSRNTAEEWSQAVAEAEGRIRLITIDTAIAQQLRGDDVIQLSGLDRAQVIAVARDAAPELAGREGDLGWVADMCDGFVKLAGPLAEALASTPGAQANQLTESRRVRDVLDLLINDRVERRVLTGLSLFLHVGFAGDLQSESMAVAEYLQVSWGDFRDAVRRVSDRGLLAQRGRYLYVTPTLLALWLVAEELGVEGRRIWEVVEKKGAPPMDRLAARIAQLEGNSHARALAGEVLGTDGPFGSMKVLDSEEASFLFRALSKVAPAESARLLHHLTEATPVGELRAMTRGRRNLVWALEDLAVPAETFAPAAASLLRLAAAENEDYANNATRTFWDLFQLVLGRTRLPAPERLDVLADLIRDASSEEAQVAITALASPLRTEEMGRPIGGDKGSAPSEGWRPANLGEVDATRRQALKMLRQTMESDIPDRRQVAISVFRSQLTSVVALGFGDEARTTLEEMALEDANDPEERELMGAIGSVVEYELENLRPDEQIAWKQLAERVLYGSFHRSMLSRVRAWDSRSSYALDQENLQGEITALALQAAQHPELLDRELGWLCAHESVPNLHVFGQSLGREDGQGTLTERLITATVTTGDARLLASYIAGRSLSEGALVTLLNRLEQHGQTREFLPRLIVLLPSSSRFWEQFRRCVGDKPSASEVLDDIAVAWFAEGLSDTEVVDLVGLLVARATPASLQVALQVLDASVAGPDADEALVELAWRVLDQSGGITSSNLWSYRWSRVAQHVMGYDRERMVASLLRQAEDEPVRFTHSTLADVLHEALAGVELSTWEKFIERLDELPELELPLQWWSQEKGALEQVPLATLEAWTQGDLDRLERLAGFARPGETSTPLVIWIVEQAGARSRAARRLRSQMGTGVFWGSLAGRDEGFRELLAEWARDSSSEAIQLWAQDGIKAIDERLPSLQEWEDETELLTG